MTDKYPRITAYISDSHAEMTHYVVCPACGGAIGFNLAELQDRRARGLSTSVYCAGDARLPDGKYDRSKEHYHPGFPPEPIFAFDWSTA